jgi:hypothetical protein
MKEHEVFGALDSLNAVPKELILRNIMATLIYFSLKMEGCAFWLTDA